MERCVLILFALVSITKVVLSGELTFELPDNERMCFHEEVQKGESATLEFQVITGGNYDVDLEITAPNGQVLYKDIKKQYDSFHWTADHKGIHSFCFSNEFSTFTHKIVYFDLEVGDERPAVEEMSDHQTAMTLMETSSVNVFENLKSVLDHQTHHRLREAQGRAFAEDLNERVLYWSIGESLVVVLIGIGQIMVLRSFFSNTHKTSSAT
ncbi:transmembrane emp24 domain-containing protein 3 [Aplysia californica]|uniref:Transmembrane emp24 domain-containing protein 3 n=1 Tax=Aplysia californica TaxID=6500 RepID=A0ABM0JNP4_APLCA|nr:transmembrane emp24 domain-containing protein 3 [Aplysia californica]